MQGGVGLIFGSSKGISCRFHRDHGPTENYSGTINKIGLERHGYGPDVVRAMKEAYRFLYRSDLNVAQAVDQMRAQLPDIPEIEHLIGFVTQSARGIIK